MRGHTEVDPQRRLGGRLAAAEGSKRMRPLRRAVWYRTAEHAALFLMPLCRLFDNARGRVVIGHILLPHYRVWLI